MKTASLRWLHRHADGADWYMMCPLQEQSFSGEVSVRSQGRAELWNPVDGSIRLADARPDGDYTRVRLQLRQGEMLFLVFRHDRRAASRHPVASRTATTQPESWTLTFPEGWGIDRPLQLTTLAPWKDLPLTDEGRAFSGTATYETVLRLPRRRRGRPCLLRLGEVKDIAVVSLNSQVVDTLWAAPYETDIAPYLRRGSNTLTVSVTGTWLNRLIFDAAQPPDERRTWVISGPAADKPLRPYGLLGPVGIDF